MKLFYKLTLAVTLAFSIGSAQAKELVLADYGGATGLADKVAYSDPFQKETGIKVLPAYELDSGGLAKLKAMVEAGNVAWDVMFLEGPDIGRACQDGLIEKIDFSKIGNRNDFMPEAVHECGVGQAVWSYVLAYNGDKLKVTPKGWADFWDLKKFPGKRGMIKSARSNLEFALMADGVPTKDVYKVLSTKAGVDRAFKKLDEIKHDVVWWDAGAQPPQLLASGDVAMTTAYSGRINFARSEGKNLQIVWAGSLYDLEYWAIPKGAKDKALSEKFIAFSTTPESQKRYALQPIAYGPTNLRSLKLLDPKALASLPNSTANSKDSVLIDQNFWTDHGEELEQRFAAWLIR